MPSERVTSAGVDEWRDVVGSWSRAWTSLLPVWPRIAPVPRSAAAPATREAPRSRTRPRGRTIRELSVGESASATRRITRDDIAALAQISGDDGLAQDADRAALSQRGGRVASGMLTAGLVAGLVGTRLPGPGSVHLSQTLRWVAPVRPDDELTVTATVAEIIPEEERVVLHTVVTRDGEPVLIGEALVKAPPRAARELRRTPIRTRAARPGATPREARRRRPA